MSVRRVVPNLTAPRLKDSQAFYVGVLGFEVGMDMGWIVTLVSPNNPTAQVSLSPGDRGAGDGPHVTIEVGDVDEVYRRAVAAGADIVRPLVDEDWGTRRFFVRDPGGWVLNVMSHQAPPEPS